MMSLLCRVFSPPAGRPARRPRPAVPALEELERRELPSASAWEAQPLTALQPLDYPGYFTTYSPAAIRHAYGIDRLPYDGAGQTIAIVTAYDDPQIYNDVYGFDRQFGLPDPLFLLKATPEGQPRADAGWAGETALDVEWAHAVAPRANLLLVEARTAGYGDLLGAVDYARNFPGVVAVSMSWAGPEFSGETAVESYFTTPAGHLGGSYLPGGVTFVAASGDSGAWRGAEWPAVSPSVLAVGGTSLWNYQGTYGGESGWSGSGGGFSQYFAEPTAEKTVQLTGHRSTPDVAYNADPSTGVLVYDSYPQPGGYSGWFAVGGTSAAAPQWAALLALADQGRASLGLGSLANAQSTIYALPAGDFHTVVGGYNGYYASTGYNLVTGRGSPVADQLVSGLIFTGSSTASNGSVGNGAIPSGTASKKAIGFDPVSAVDLLAALRTTPTFSSAGAAGAQPLGNAPSLAPTQTATVLQNVTRNFYTAQSGGDGETGVEAPPPDEDLPDGLEP